RGAVQQWRSYVHEIQARRTGVHPGHAMGAEIVPNRSMKAADHRRAASQLEALTGNSHAQREAPGGHHLTSPAMATHGDQRRPRYLEGDLSTAALAAHR